MQPLRKVLLSKLHRLTVTGADLDYEGSLTLPPELLDASGIREFEAIDVWNVTRGTRFQTYAIAGRPGSSDVCVNGAAAHLAATGDIIIVAAFVLLPESLLSEHRPKAIFVDRNNKIVETRPESAGPG